MIFKKTKIKGSFIIEPEKIKDTRGFFAPIWNSDEFKKKGLSSKLFECNISFNKKKGTLRGLHYQIIPYEGSKLVRCTRGKIFDVIVDLRPKPGTYLKWIGDKLSSNNHKMNYVPEGCAHGFQTLEDSTEVFYQMSQIYMSLYARGVRWDDPTFNISWPLKPTIISKKDTRWKNFQ